MKRGRSESTMRNAFLWLCHNSLLTLKQPRIDCSVLPLLFLGLLVFQLDRMNIASALTGGFAADINVDQNTINLGNQLMFMGIVLLEIPSNMALQWVSKTPQPAKPYGIRGY